MTTTSSVASVRASSLLSSWAHLPTAGVVSSLPSQVRALGAGTGSCVAVAPPTARAALFARITALLDAGGDSAWSAMQLVKSVVTDDAPEDDGGAAALRPFLDQWSRTLQRLLRTLLDTPRAGTTTTPPLSPLLCIGGFESLCSVLRRLHDSWPDVRREVTNTTLPSVVPLLIKMIAATDTYTWKADVSASVSKDATVASASSQWRFPPERALVRSLALLLDLLCLYRHSMRFATDKILSDVTPLLDHADSDVRGMAARVLAACAMIQPVTAKKKQQVGDEEDEEPTTKAPTTYSNHPEDPWTMCVHRTINTLHVLLDEMDQAGDALLLEANAWKSLPRPTDAVLPLPHLPSSSSSQPLTRADVFARRVLGLCELLRALLERSLFSELHVPAAGSSHDAVTVALPVAALQAVLGRIFTYELNPHQLSQITGRAMSRTAIAAILPSLLRGAVGVVSAMLDIAGVHAQSIALALGQSVRDLLARNAVTDGRHALPDLVPDLYALAGQLLSAVNGGGAALVRGFVLPLLMLATDDAERLVRSKNALAQYERGASNMAAFTGAALPKAKESRRSGGAGGKSEQSDALGTYARTQYLAQTSIAAVAALEFIDTVITTSGPMLPQQKRIQLDRSLCSIAMAVQNARYEQYEQKSAHV